jgi:hypothetical protein
MGFNARSLPQCIGLAHRCGAIGVTMDGLLFETTRIEAAREARAHIHAAAVKADDKSPGYVVTNPRVYTLGIATGLP